LSAGFSRAAFYFLTALTCVSSFRAVGVLVVLALLVGPFLTVRLFCHRLQWLLLWTPLLAVFSCVVSVALARALLSIDSIALSTGGILSAVISLLFIFACLLKRFVINSAAFALKVGK